MATPNTPEYFDDLSDEELAGAERVATNRRNEAHHQYALEQSKLQEIRRVRNERTQKKISK